MKRLILDILLVILAVCFTGCISVTRHKEEHVHSAPVPLPGHSRPVFIKPAESPPHGTHHYMARRPEPMFRHPRP